MGSRVFVRGLPPSMTDEDFKIHFSKKYKVTDAKLFQRRRIGYVGFETPEQAASAVKYFNKSFIRMSKIFVELAHNIPSHADSLPPTAKKDNLSSTILAENHTSTDTSLKRKRDANEKVDGNPKLKEFLAVMQPQPKTRDLHDQLNTKGKLTTVEEDALARSHTDGREIQQVEPAVQKTTISTAQNRSPVADDPNTKASVEGVESRVEMEQAARDADAINSGTDADWMRNRTSRLLGLLEDDEKDDAMHNKESLPNDDLSKTESQTRESHEFNIAFPGQKIDVLNPSDAMSVLEDESSDRQAIGKSGRLFLRNLAYTITEDDLRELFQSSNTVNEIHLPLDTSSGQPKGFAFVQFEDPEEAKAAFARLDGTTFQGRLLHIIAAESKRNKQLEEFDVSKLPIKKQKQIQRKAQASSAIFNWNSLYMNANAVVSSIADRLGISKSELLDPSSSDAGVKQAQAETHIIQETKAYFKANGVDLGAFGGRDRDDRALLVKNFAYGTTRDELEKLFGEHGIVVRVLMPPSGIIAIIEYAQVPQARSALGALAYRKFKESVLFLEKAPRAIFDGSHAPPSAEPPTSVLINGTKPAGKAMLGEAATEEALDTSTLFVRNLSFATTNDRFNQVFQPLEGLVSARVKTKTDSKKPGQVLSMGFGFLEFRTPAQAQAALSAMDGYLLDGHQLSIKASHKGQDVAAVRRKEDEAKRLRNRKSKIVIKNLPFEASKKDVQNLFKSYGQLRAVRMPKKFDNSRKGFAFAEFTTAKEAENAMDALRNTHLLGRRLVLDFAAGDAEDPEREIERMQQKVGRQFNSVALQKMANTERRKFNLSTGNEELDA